MNILFDTFLPNGPLPNLLDSDKFKQNYIYKKDTLQRYLFERKDYPMTGIGFPYFILYFYENKKVNFIPSYMCDRVDSWIYPVHFDNSAWYGTSLLTSGAPFKLDSYLSKKVYSGLVDGNGFLMLFFEGEALDLGLLDTFLNITLIPRHKIIVHSTTVYDNLQNYRHSIYNEIIAVKDLTSGWNTPVPSPSFWSGDYEIIPGNFDKDQYKYVCLNHFYDLPHKKFRALISALLIKDTIENDGILSLSQSPNLYDYLEQNKFNFHNDLTSKLLSNKKDISNISQWADFKDVKKAYFHIILDSYFTNHPLYFTEKIYEPVTLKQFLVVLGLPYTLKYFRQLGYKTFDPIIDESYDEESNDELRFIKAYKEIQKICSMDLNQLKNLSQKLNNILEYNYNHMKKRIENSFKEVETIIDENI